MKTEKELRSYADKVITQLHEERKDLKYVEKDGKQVADVESVNFYAIRQAKTILNVLMYVLDDYTICDLNRL